MVGMSLTSVLSLLTPGATSGPDEELRVCGLQEAEGAALLLSCRKNP